MSKKHWSKKKDMWMCNFKSSNLKLVGYHLAKQTLYIQFKDKDGNVTNEYKYKGVSLEWFVNFTLAESKGKFFAKAKYDLVHVEKLL